MGRVKVVVEAEAPEQSTHVKQQRKAHAHPRQAGKPAAKSKPDFKPHVAVPGAHPIPRSRQKQGGKRRWIGCTRTSGRTRRNTRSTRTS